MSASQIVAVVAGIIGLVLGGISIGMNLCSFFGSGEITSKGSADNSLKVTHQDLVEAVVWLFKTLESGRIYKKPAWLSLFDEVGQDAD